MPDKTKILQHIHEPEKITMLRHILDLPEIASRNYTTAASDFLDPYERRLVESIVHHFPDLIYRWLPEEAWERKCVVFSPYPFDEVEEILSAFRITSSSPLEHRAVLGSILGLGVERRKIGDVVIGSDSYVIVKREIADFIETALKKVGNSYVTLTPISIESVPLAEEPWKEASAVVSSMRLDAVVRAVTHGRRDDVKAQLSKGLIKVNFKVIERAHEIVAADDLISVRGFGRIKILGDIAETKKGKIRFRYATLDRK